MSHMPFIIIIDDYCSIQSEASWSLDDALDIARGVDEAGISVQSITQGGDVVLQGSALLTRMTTLGSSH